MGVAGQVGQYLLWPCERTLGIDEPVRLPQRCQVGLEGCRVGEMLIITEELEAARGTFFTQTGTPAGCDDKYALAQGTRLRNSARVGSSMLNVDPLPGVDTTQIRPPCISTICLAMASPSPVPPLALVRELSTWWN